MKSPGLNSWLTRANDRRERGRTFRGNKMFLAGQQVLPLSKIVGLVHFFWADDRKGYTATIPRHRAVQLNTPRFLTPILDADWSTQPRTGFRRQLLAVRRTAASKLGRHRFLTRPITLSVAKYTMRTDFAPGFSRHMAVHFSTESKP